jgi:hypothetical protein
MQDIDAGELLASGSGAAPVQPPKRRYEAVLPEPATGLTIFSYVSPHHDSVFQSQLPFFGPRGDPFQ